MRSIVLSLMSVAALALAGCNSSSDSSPKAAAESAAPAAPANIVSGTVSLRDASQTVSGNAKLDLKLVDVSTQSAAPLATKTIQPLTLPASFQLEFTPGDVNPADIYVVQAVVTDGDRRFTQALQTPVLTKNAPSANLAIQLVSEMTPGEKELAAFTTVQKNIGAMKVKSGTALASDKESRGWQVFSKGNDVQFVRELVDYGDKGFSSTDFAYKGGKPWVIVQQKKSSKDAKPSSTERAGWNDAGELVLKQSEAGGKLDTLSDDEANSLRKAAEDMYSRATKTK
ncbi:MAG TPA: YbaY family lipoprotein [Luteibacter sp.]|jgi:putative lipoprotein|nr:YbaY family lipoprotein [Luteibacter sp.]